MIDQADQKNEGHKAPPASEAPTAPAEQAPLSTTNTIALLVPHELRLLGYTARPELQRLAEASIEVAATHISYRQEWRAWRGILDYLSYVEFARSCCRSVPRGARLGHDEVFHVQYHSLALVFLCRAAIDLVAVWLVQRRSLTATGSDCGFHKKKFVDELCAHETRYRPICDAAQDFLLRLDGYRQFWIHRQAGGAIACCDGPPDAPGAEPFLAVPVAPHINPCCQDGRSYLKAVNKARTKNEGEWLVEVGPFADMLADGTRDFILELLAVELPARNP
jgi:hypothetical protein